MHVGIDSSDDDCDLELQVPRQRLWPGLSSDEEEERDFELVSFNISLLYKCGLIGICSQVSCHSGTHQQAALK